MPKATRDETVRLEHIPIAVALVATTGIVDWANAAMQELLGHDPAGRPLLDLVAPSSVDHVQHVLDFRDTRTVAFRHAQAAGRVVDLFSAQTAGGGASVVFAHRAPSRTSVQ